jgi:hypothetical protein
LFLAGQFALPLRVVILPYWYGTFEAAAREATGNLSGLDAAEWLILGGNTTTAEVARLRSAPPNVLSHDSSMIQGSGLV